MPVKKKVRKSYRELYNDLAPKSFCATTIHGNLTNPDLVHIRLIGPIANVPSLKNMKIQGTNILRPEAKVLLDIMTRAFQKSVNFKIPTFDEKVFCLVVCAYRKVSFDEDNTITTVKDWLEPSHIRKKNREWGAAIVSNDRFVTAYGVKKRKTAPEPLITEIYLKRLETVQPALSRFLFEAVGLDVEKLY